MRKFLCLYLTVLTLFYSCNEKKKELIVGDWWAKMNVSPSEILPFNFTLSKADDAGYIMEMYNSDEVIIVDEIEVNNDSIRIKMPVFEGYITGTFTENEIKGDFVKESLDRIVPFMQFMANGTGLKEELLQRSIFPGFGKPILM